MHRFRLQFMSTVSEKTKTTRMAIRTTTSHPAPGNPEIGGSSFISFAAPSGKDASKIKYVELARTRHKVCRRYFGRRKSIARPEGLRENTNKMRAPGTRYAAGFSAEARVLLGQKDCAKNPKLHSCRCTYSALPGRWITCRPPYFLAIHHNHVSKCGS